MCENKGKVSVMIAIYLFGGQHVGENQVGLERKHRDGLEAKESIPATLLR